MFSDGTPEEWLKFLIDFEETIIQQYSLQNFEQELLVLKTVLDCLARERADTAIRAVPLCSAGKRTDGPMLMAL